MIMDENGIEMQTLWSPMGLQGQVEALRDMPSMPLQSEYRKTAGEKMKRLDTKILERMYWGEKKSLQKIADEAGFASHKSIHYWMVKFGIPRRSHSKALKLAYKNKIRKPCRFFLQPVLVPSKELAYIIGVIKGDGCVCLYPKIRQGFVQLSQIHQKFGDSFEKALREIGFHPHTFITMRKAYPKPIFVTRGYSIKFVQWYKQLSFEDIERVLDNNPEFIRAFIRGFFESEGSNFTTAQGRWVISFGNTNRELAYFVLNLLGKMNFNFHLVIDSKPHPSRHSSKTYYIIHNGKKPENLRFIQEVAPCIKNNVPLGVA